MKFIEHIAIYLRQIIILFCTNYIELIEIIIDNIIQIQQIEFSYESLCAFF